MLKDAGLKKNKNIKALLKTLVIGKTMNAPPPADSVITARNFGFTEQNVESQDDLDTLSNQQKL